MTCEELLAIRDIMREELQPINSRLDRVESRLDRIELSIENEIKPAIRLLAEGQQNILEHMPRQEQLDRLEERMDASEAAIREHSRILHELVGA